MQHRLGGERGFIIRDAIGGAIRGAACISDDAALGTLSWGAAPLTAASTSDQPPTALVSNPRHLSHRPTLCLTNTDISSLPYKTPWNFYREGMILPVFGFVYPEVRE